VPTWLAGRSWHAGMHECTQAGAASRAGLSVLVSRVLGSPRGARRQRRTRTRVRDPCRGGATDARAGGHACPHFRRRPRPVNARLPPIPTHWLLRLSKLQWAQQNSVFLVKGIFLLWPHLRALHFP
jgi:hypothetical protein